MVSNHLQHYGIKGMRWGVRLYQNPDGSRTLAGKLRYGSKSGSGNGRHGQVGKSRPSIRDRINYARNKNKPDPSTFHEDYKTAHDKSKKIYQMSNEELKTKISRLQLERTYASLSPAPVSRGKAFVDQMMKLAKQGQDFAKSYAEFGRNLEDIQSVLLTGKVKNGKKK